MKDLNINLNELKNKSIALIYGGRSPEHEVSISSARGVYPLLKKLSRNVFIIGISREGSFFLQNHDKNDSTFLINNYTIEDNIIEENILTLHPAKGIFLKDEALGIDIAFLVTHGNEGEDGKLQSLLQMINVKYTGCDPISSSICMSKAFCSTILKSNGIKVLDSIVFDRFHPVLPLSEVQKKLGSKLFIKSETTGSSVGVCTFTKDDDESFKNAIENSFKYSERVLVQKLVENMREIECAVLELTDDLLTGGPGLVVKPNNENLLSYKIKYAPINGAKMCTDNNLSPAIKDKAITTAQKAFKTLNLKGYSRIDFFLTSDDELILNEINTLPGLTTTSHFPILIESTGLSFKMAVAQILSKALYG